MHTKNKALVLDLDDTLYSELDFLKSAYFYIAKNILPQDCANLYAQMLSMHQSGENTFASVAEKYSHVSIQQLLEWYRWHKPNIQLFAGAKEMLEYLRPDWKFAIVTDGRSKTQRNKIQSLGIEHLLDTIVISEEIGSEKPNIDNFKLVEDSLNCQEYIYLADNPKKDFLAPKKLRWRTICLLNQGNNIHSQDFSLPADFLPDYCISNWTELLNSFNEGNRHVEYGI